jgi:outer membrane receptor protein involved in Fe transport
MKMTVSSKAATTLREQPGILSVITGEEIRRSGARDLVDVLRLVPGMYFGSDVNGVTGIGIRGNWAHEGKLLTLVDGQEMNDLTYAIYPYGNHFPVDQIKRIEIIRGPGSSLYGGAAELGVINIITRQGEDIGGLSVSMTTGRYQDMFGRIARELSHGRNVHSWDAGRANVNVSLGEKIKDVEFNLHAYLGTANRANAVLQTMYLVDDEDPSQGFLRDSLSETGHGETPSANVNFGLKWRDLSLRLIYDRYATWGIDAIVYDNLYVHGLGEIRYDWTLLDGKLKIIPKFNFKRMVSWYQLESVSNKLYMRSTGNVSFLADPTAWFNLTGGVEFYYDQYRFLFTQRGMVDMYGDVVDNVFYNGKPEIDFRNSAVFLQGLARLPWGMNLTAGGRYEHHSQYGSAFAPRFGITQIVKDWHFKLLLSKAFRSPSIGALVLPFDQATIDNPRIRPEETYVGEIEAGYRINKHMFVTANVFDIIMTKPICYIDIGDIWGYQNAAARTGSRGIELEYALKANRANVTANYSYYTNKGKDRILMARPDGSVFLPFNMPDNEGAYIAAPQHKLGLNASVNPWKELFVAPSMVLMSSTPGYTHAVLEESDGWTYPVQVAGEIEPTVLFNLYLTYENLGLHGLTLGAGIYDLFDTRYPFMQAYNGLCPPLPAGGREFLLKLSYNLPYRR